jgi:two-component system cell cycle sensor histidine kinase/response regulator CckA
MLNELIPILTQFAGGPGDPANNVVRFLLAAFFWAALSLVSFWLWRSTNDRRHMYFSIAAAVGVSRELFMFIAEYGSFRGYISFPAIFRYYPPIEHSVAILSTILMGYAFLRFYFSYERFSKLFLIYSSLLTTLTYVTIAPLWIMFLEATRNPTLNGGLFIGAQFHDFMGDLVFRLLGAVVALVVLGAFLFAKTRQIRFSWLALAAFVCFFIDDALQAVNDLCNDRYAPLFAPIRHFLHIAAIVQLVGAYWWEVTRRFNDRERFLNSLMDAVPDHIFYKNTESVFVGCNRTFADTFVGRPKDQIIGQFEKDLVRDEALTHLSQQSAMEAIAADSSRIYEAPYTLTNGKQVLLETIQTPFHDDDGRVAGLIGVSRDITERKQGEQDLVRLHQQYELILDSATDGILGLDVQGNHTFINSAAARMLGYEVGELIGRPSHSLWHHTKPDGSAYPREECQIYAAYRDGIVHRSSTEVFWRKDGSRLPVEYASTPIVEEGRLAGAVVTFADITDRTRAEKERLTLERQLQQSQKMESVGRLAGGVAHDFNNMLALVLGHAELALEQIDPTHPLHTDLQEVRKAAERSAGLTRQLLAFARQQTVELRVLDLNETVANMLKMLQRLIGEDIDLKWQSKANLWSVKMDPTQIDQILTNLCVNARDAIPDTGKITIGTGNIGLDDVYCADHAGAVPGDYVVLMVSDSGCGMDKATTEKIFEPFFTTKGVGKGTGLGLSTVFGIVKQNNGFINVESEPGQGTTFTIYLPRYVGKTEPAQPESRQGPALRGQETILLVEDEPAILTLTARMLARQGYTVLEANSPGKAISLAGEHAGEIHLLMTDVVMPGMNGRDLAITLLDVYPHLKRLFTSGYTADVITRHGVLDEGVHFIQKPFSTRALAAKVRELLDQP